MKKTVDKSSLNFRSEVKEWVSSLVEAFIIVGVLFIFCWPIKVEGSSMEEAFHTNDIVFFSRLAGKVGSIDKSDIIICKTNDDNKNIKILKRVIAVPGDKISIENGTVYLNGKILDENYVEYKDETSMDEITLNTDEYFILGDNRVISHDSRQFGVVSKKSIVGKVLFRAYPFSEIKKF